MKRPGNPDSLGVFMSICPTTEGQSPRNSHIYSSEFLSMLDSLDEEACLEGSGQAAEKKRRLNVDQVKALEKNFEVENKLEPERKVKLAQELGLQPRQVAVWFQNRRARCKTKQLERDYSLLKSNYDSLKHSFDSLQRDNETLLKEIRGLKSKLNEENRVVNSEIENKVVEIAVKQLGRRGLQGHKEWVTEVNVLGVAEHPNLVKLLGYCADDDERGIQRLLIYEYLPNGSVHYHLSPLSPTPLSWAMRLKIAQDAAHGLTYLHEKMDFQIIFRDFKSSNILLDDQWNAKLSDFGLARLGPSEGSTHVSTAVIGTMGYAAPEYVQTGRLTCKNDVWSYGVFLYELITGRGPFDKNRPKSEQKLLEWVKPYLSDAKKFRQILDPRLERIYSVRSIHKLSIVANKCLVRNYKSRPKMSEVLEMVNQVVLEASTETGSPSRPPMRSSVLTRSSEETQKKGKRRITDTKTGDNWLIRMWSSKLLKTC